MTERVIMAGFGGQGLMMIGRLFAAGGMRQGLEVTFFPSYGAEVRGGTANCHVVVSDAAIYSPIIETPDALILMNQLSYEKFRPRLKSGGLLVLNSSMAEPDEALERALEATRLLIPATEIADGLGNVRVANIVMLGAYAAARPILPAQALVAGLEAELGQSRAHLIEVNRQAFRRGVELASHSAQKKHSGARAAAST